MLVSASVTDVRTPNGAAMRCGGMMSSSWQRVLTHAVAVEVVKSASLMSAVVSPLVAWRRHRRQSVASRQRLLTVQTQAADKRVAVQAIKRWTGVPGQLAADPTTPQSWIFFTISNVLNRTNQIAYMF